jgi:hypothetical protein
MERYGFYAYLNAHDPKTAIYADFDPSPGYPYGSCWRITPDGAAEDVTSAFND